MKWDFFIAHAGPDTEVAELLFGFLDPHAEVFLDSKRLILGDDWDLELSKAQQESLISVIIVSSKIESAYYQREEIAAAIQLARENPGSHRVVPIYLDKEAAQTVPYGLRLKHGLLLNGMGELEVAAKKLLVTLSKMKGAEFAPRGKEKIEQGVLPEPGPLPSGSRIPFIRNFVFTGRRDALLALADALLPDRNPSQLGVTRAATGMGGVGKTQLAVEFAYRYGRFFKGVHWVQASANVEKEIAACGLAMGVQPWPDEVAAQAMLTLTEWQKASPRLIIFDNVVDTEILQKWLPRLQGSRVLVTSRKANWPAALGMETFGLEMLSPQESLELLHRLAPRLENTPDPELEALAKTLGYLPLAIDIAGNYLEAAETLKVSRYVQQLRQGKGAISHKSLKERAENLATRHETSLLATFSLGWDEIKNQNARLIFLACGFCAPNLQIPPAVFEIGLELKEKPEEVGLALNELYAFGFLRKGERGQPLIHPLLAEYARCLDREMESTGLQAAAEGIQTAANNAGQTGLPNAYSTLPEHLAIAAPLAEANRHALTGKLYNELGYYQDMVGDYENAKTAYECALTFDEVVYGPRHGEVAIRINNLGEVLRKQGDYPGAKAAFERDLSIEEEIFGHDHPRVAIVSNNMGLVLNELGDYSAAISAFERAIAIDEAEFGFDHPDVATDVHNLGLVLTAQGNFLSARASFERALNIFEKHYGKKHPSVGVVFNSLGRVSELQGDIQEAKAAYEQALEIFEKNLPDEHPNIQLIKDRLAGLGK